MKLRLLPSAWLALSTTLQAAPEEVAFGRDQGYPYPTSSTINFMRDDYRVGLHSNAEAFLPVVAVKRGDSVLALPREAEPRITYKLAAREYTLQDYLDRNYITGLMIIKDGKVLVERYQYDRKPEQRFLSNSMAKSFTAFLIGVALGEGKIKSLDDRADVYASTLKGTPYGKVTIRNLLRMSSGVAFSMRYDGGYGDNSRLWEATIRHRSRGGADALSFVKDGDQPQGTKFSYSAGDTFALAVVLEGATGQKLADYTSEKLWKPMGAQSDAYWAVDMNKTPAVQCCWMSTLRDYGRLGILLANDGAMNGKELIPGAYLREATDRTKQPAYLQPRVASPFFGYGYQVWTLPYVTRSYAMVGAYGQILIVQPETKTVVVMTAAWKKAGGDASTELERIRFVHGIFKAVGARSDFYYLSKDGEVQVEEPR